MTDHPAGQPNSGQPQAAPPEPALGPAAAHLAAAEDAARRADFGTALRERYRAVTRGLEQRGILEEQRARTAGETARAASAAVPEDAAELPWAAHSFDEVVYGGRPAGEAEYRRLAEADRFSVAPAPKSAPAEVTAARRKKRVRKTRDKRDREPFRWPPILSDWRFWAVLGGTLVVLVLIYVLLNAGAPPDVPDVPDKPDPPSKPPEVPDRPREFGEGQDSIFETMPAWAAFGGLQFLIAWGLVLCWRGRRRGTVVEEPLPVRAPAHELLAGQAGLYRKSHDHDHVAGKLRAATLRRLRPVLSLTADSSPELVVGAVAARSGADPALVRAALYEPVADRATLEVVAAQLEWIEAEVL
ncbi:DUF4129 domain-containing protein [Nocardia sp. NPDC005978]|uniref:DUF4129 domain-containing protein n=1 Tax=unclassified Nocardia TaxID=2637762 RepID=UPI0033B502B3